MEFEWDEAKSERNRIERELPFDLAIELFEGFVIEEPDTRRDYGERRIRAVGEVDGLTLLVVYTDRADIRRIISVRQANRRERNAYREAQQRGH